MLNIYRAANKLIYIICLGFFWQSCNVINPIEPTPTYIHIDSFHFVQTPDLASLKLPLTHSITNVWVYYKGNLVGAFDLPCTIPIIATGNQTVTLFPGVIVNGMNSLTGFYPFYSGDTFTLAARPGKIDTVYPTTGYYSSINQLYSPLGQAFISRFDGTLSGFKWISGTTPMIPMQYETADSLVMNPGDRSGNILFTATNDSAVYESADSFLIPGTAGNAFVEFDYKSSMPFYVGISANLSVISTTSEYLGGFYPNYPGWSKIYLTVDGFATQYKGTSYFLYIKTALPPGQPYGRLLIENLQILTD